MPEYSGVAGILPPAPIQEQPAGQQIMGFIERMVNIKNAQKAQAAAQLESTVRMASEYGFAVDPKAIDKLVKKSGLPFSTKAEDQAAGVLANKMDASMKGSPTSAHAEGTKGGGFDPTGGSGGAQNPALSSRPAGGTGPMNQVAGMPPAGSFGQAINQMAEHARKMHAADSANQELITQATNRVLSSGGKDAEAVGILVGLNKWHFDVDWEKWKQLSPEDRLNLARGNETPGDLAKRTGGIAKDLIDQGYADPSTAYAVAPYYAKGAQPPADLQSKMRARSIDDLGKEADLGRKLVEMYPGMSTSQVQHAAEVAQRTGDLTAGLPGNLKPTSPANRQAAAAEKEVNISAVRAAADIERAKAEMTLAQARAKTEAQKGALDDYKALVEVKKSGGKIDQKVLDAAQAKVADQFGMDAKYVKTWWDYVTFSDEGSQIQFEPRLTDAGKSTIDRLTGKPTVPEGVGQRIQQMGPSPKFGQSLEEQRRQQTHTVPPGGY